MLLEPLVRIHSCSYGKTDMVSSGRGELIAPMDHGHPGARHCYSTSQAQAAKLVGCHVGCWVGWDVLELVTRRLTIMKPAVAKFAQLMTQISNWCDIDIE